MPSPKKLIAIWWQSNAIGSGLVADLTYRPEVANPYPAVQFHQWIGPNKTDPILWIERHNDLKPRDFSYGGNPIDSFGVELTLGRDLDARFPNQIEICKVAIGNTGLNDHWKPASGYPVNPEELLEQFMDFTQESLDLMPAGSELAAVVGIGGEWDSVASDDASSVATHSTSIANAIRTRFGAGVVFAFNRLSSGASGAGAFKNTVRAQQESLVTSLARSVMVNADDLTFADTLHFDANSYARLGERFADAIAPFLAGTARSGLWTGLRSGLQVGIR